MSGHASVQPRPDTSEARGVSIYDTGRPPGNAGPDDVVVVIDVIRAFTTACLLFHRGVTEIVCARDWTDASGISPEAVMMGETESGPLPPEVLRNSPTDVGQRKLPGRRVTLFTVNGTRALATAPPGGVLMAAAAVNARATAAWILTRGAERVGVVVSDPASPEDRACATYLTGLLKGTPVDSATISQAITAGRTTHWDRWGRW